MAEALDAGDPRSVQRAAAALADGELVVIPTDTLYGVAARPDLPEATARIFEAKARPRELTLPVLAADAPDAAVVAALDDRASLLAERFWPGPLTIVLPRTARSRPWDLGEETETVGVRVPDHPVARAVLRATGPLAVTSANLSGQPTPPTCDEVRAALGDRVAVYLDAGPLEGEASTVVGLLPDGVRVLRVGALPEAEILSVLSR